uniref:(northern house mosquito) hypothetical protein n=1 Tax=Culex pipiens TaxID=7175 RepID=A0A8D8AA96_CULPI
MFFFSNFFRFCQKKETHTTERAETSDANSSRHSFTHQHTHPRLSLCNTSLSVRERRKKVKKKQTKEKNNLLGTHHRRDQFFSLPREESKRKFIKRHFDTHTHHHAR